MSRPLAYRAALALAAWALAATNMLACNGAPDDIRDWTPSDHDQPARQAGQVPERASSASPSGDAAAPELIDLAWQRNCATCHGRQGRGDGPQGPMMRSPDLTRPDWQARVTDDQIAEVIRKGRNKMPAFDLPAPVISGLVSRIRSSRARN
jgi:cytochrome c oxidase cbb3-type subunit 3